MSAGKYIDNYTKEEINKLFLEQWTHIKSLLDDLTYFCDNYYEDNIDKVCSKQKLDEKYENKVKGSEIKSCKPCVCKSLDVIKESFHSNLDELRNEFLDTYNELSISDVGLIYQFVEFLKERC
jgi:hypothetical protein